jgi:hypothetical protein
MYSSENKTLRGGGWIALAGAVAWCSLMAIQPPGWAQALFLLAPLVALPLTLPLFGAWERIHIAFAVAAWLLIPAFVLDRGVTAASFTVPWLLLCVALAVAECARWRQLDLGRVLMAGYLAVGAGWLLLARLGARPLGFEDVIVQATAVHFHYAGFVLPVVMRRLADADERSLTRWSVWGILLGVPLVAAGITLTAWQVHALESAATLFLAGACWIAAWQQAAFAQRRREPCFRAAVGTRWLLTLSSLSLAAAMLLAVIYAAGQLTGAAWLDIPFMLRFHGCAQVFGFALPALAAWHWLEHRYHVGQDSAPVRPERTRAESCPT